MPRDSRGARLELLTGAASVVLVIAAALIVGIYDYLPPGERLVDFFSGNARRVTAGGYLGSLGGVLLIWFAGVCRAVLREKEGGSGRHSTLAFGGGVAAGMVLVAGFAMLSMAGARAGAAGGISVGEAAVLYDVWSGLSGLALPVSLAVLVGAAAIAARRVALIPSWAGWASAAVTLGCLSPVGYFAQILAVIWVLVVSVWFYQRFRG